MNTIANRQVICDVLLDAAEQDPSIMVLCSDSRGSASLSSFQKNFPSQFVEVGIAEQNLVSIAAGMANAGSRPFVASPACFLSARSYEQIKVDICYSHTNVKLIGISGGISYGALGMTHHSTQDIAGLAALPYIRVYLPSDRFQTEFLLRQLLQDQEPAYIRIGRNPVEDVYTKDSVFELDRAVMIRDGKDLTLIACGELVHHAVEAASLLEKDGISSRVLDMYCVHPIDRASVLSAASETGRIVTVEEHSPHGGLGDMVCRITAESCPVPVKCLTLPETPVITGNSAQVFQYYKLHAMGIAQTVKEWIRL